MFFKVVVLVALINIVLSYETEGVIRKLTFNDINFLHTTDTHGWYSGHLNQQVYGANWGDFVLFSTHMKSLAHLKGQDLLLVDSGDRHDGNGLSDITEPNGARSIPIFIRQHYDVVTLGNHELYLAENSDQEVDVVIPHYGENYVCSNVEYTKNGKWHPFGRKYRYFTTEKQGKRILSFAFLFDFNRYNSKTKVTPIAEAIHQPWFNEVLEQYPAEKVDMVLVVGHISVDRRWSELGFLHAKLRDHYPSAKIQYFGGHSHIRDFVVYDDMSTGLQSGRFCETVGFLSINMTSDDLDLKSRYSRSYIDFNKQLFVFHSGVGTENFDTYNGTATNDMIEIARRELDLDRQIGYVQDSNYYVDYVPLTHPKNLFRLLTKKVMPLLEPDYDNVTVSDQRLIIINTGSVRYDMYKGPYTIDTHYIISPFKNDWMKVTLPKHIAIQITPLLNRKQYIISEGSGTLDSDYLKPPHQRYIGSMRDKSLAKSFESSAFESSGFGSSQVGSAGIDQYIMKYPGIIQAIFDSKRLTKGYVTVDDFGSDGDDTRHRAVVNYPVPNVVQSMELKTSSKHAPVDVVFYTFILPNIKSAVEELGYKLPEVQLYSKKYLGLLLNDYVASNQV